LPDGYFAEEMVTVGGRVEIDVASFEEQPAKPHAENAERNGGAVAIAKKTWTPPAPSVTIPAVFPDSFSVKVYASEGGVKLVGAIELVIPANKDRGATRLAFAIKCANYLYQGVGVIIVDIVTSRQANLHNAIGDLLGQAGPFRMDDGIHLYAVGYRPVMRDNQDLIDAWQQPLLLGQNLPTMPLALSGLVVVPIELETTYEDVRRRRID
jgi:hypothetical protein